MRIFGVFFTAFVMMAGLVALPVLATDGDYKQQRMERGGHHGKMFKKMDADENGVITRGEHEAFAKKKFDSMDADGDGNVTSEEVERHHEQMREKMMERREHSKGKKRRRSSGNEYEYEHKSDDDNSGKFPWQ